MLELSGRRQTLGENRNFLRMERSYGPFRRAFDLGAPVDVDGISAAFEAGVLRVLVPKRRPAGSRSRSRRRRMMARPVVASPSRSS